MREALKAYAELAIGLSEVTRQRAVKTAQALVSHGEATAEQVSALTEDLLAHSRHNREAVTSLVKFEVDRALGRVGLASADEVGDLSGRLRASEEEVRELRLALRDGASDSTAPAGRGSAAPAAAPASRAAVPATGDPLAPTVQRRGARPA